MKYENISLIIFPQSLKTMSSWSSCRVCTSAHEYKNYNSKTFIWMDHYDLKWKPISVRSSWCVGVTPAEVKCSCSSRLCLGTSGERTCWTRWKWSPATFLFVYWQIVCSVLGASAPSAFLQSFSVYIFPFSLSSFLSNVCSAHQY